VADERDGRLRARVEPQGRSLENETAPAQLDRHEGSRQKSAEVATEQHVAGINTQRIGAVRTRLLPTTADQQSSWSSWFRRLKLRRIVCLSTLGHL